MQTATDRHDSPLAATAGYRVARLGPAEAWSEFSIRHPLSPKPVKGKKFLTGDLGLTAMEVSVNRLPAGFAVPFLHRHRHHEELYLFLDGDGEFIADGERIAITPGTAIRVAPPVARSWRSTGDKPLVYLVVQATEHSLSGHEIEDGEPCGGNPWKE